MDYRLRVNMFTVTVIYIILTVTESVFSQDQIHAPCYSCVFYKLNHQQQPHQTHKSVDGACTFPCYCDVHILNCEQGVSVIQDGCGCCNICARQKGQSCNRRLRCDEQKSLYCNMDDVSRTDGLPHNGTCMVRNPKPCVVNDVEYEHGEQFNPNCSLLCTCHNGGYGCVSLCPQEERPPQESCAHPQLIPVPEQCCKEWTCDPVEQSSTPKEAYPYPQLTDVMSDSVFSRPLPILHVNDYPSSISKAIFHVPSKNCQINTTAWSPCSVTCGVGLSVRMTTDLTTCQTVQQSQICYVRPCDTSVLLGEMDNRHGNCTPTVKSRSMHSIMYDGCHSLETKHFRFCGFCGENTCCMPRRIKTIMMEFDCGEEKRRALNVMWIRKCHCIRHCSLRNYQ